MSRPTAKWKKKGKPTTRKPRKSKSTVKRKTTSSVVVVVPPGGQKKSKRRAYTRPKENPSWFKKGEINNPLGRPRLTPAQTKDRAAFQQACRDRTPDAMGVIEELMSQADRDSTRLVAASYIIDHGFGGAAIRAELTGKDGGPIQTQDVPLSEDELRAELLKRGLPTVILNDEPDNTTTQSATSDPT